MLIATKAFTYAGKKIKVGDKFEARDARDAKVMRAIGRAKDHIDLPPPRPQTYQTRQMVAKPAAAVDETMPGATTDGAPKRAPAVRQDKEAPKPKTEMQKLIDSPLQAKPEPKIAPKPE